MSESEKDAMKQLQSWQSELLDKIDGLRSIGVGGIVELPQLIVCGNQNSGKSSVLEAISRVRFPTKSNVCTRFATEVVLRRRSQPRVKVSIDPAPSKSNQERDRLRSFDSEEFSNGDDLPKVIEQAEKHMGLSDREFSDDVLRIEISGPEKPELTLVDLPGLYVSTSKEQNEEGIEMVRRITDRYMENNRSIILAVISAKMDFHLQEVLNRAKRFDEKYERVLGIITQPDTLEEGSEQERNYLQIVRNENIRLQLGWHALCNRSFKTKDSSDDERDEREREVFGTGSWASVPRDSVGVDSLRTRLSKCLLNHICRTLPSLVADIESKILDREQRMAKLGQERSSIQDQRGYLIDISSGFERIASQGLNGMYDDQFFGGLGSNSEEENFRKLRAVIRTLHELFFNAMEANGSRRKIFFPKGISGWPRFFNGSALYMDISQPKYIIREDLEKELVKEAQNHQGLELPGSANHLLVGALFRDQVTPWEKIAHAHLIKCWESVKYFVHQVLRNFTDDHTLFALTNTIIAPQLEGLKDSLENKLKELTLNLKAGHPLPVGGDFLSKMIKVRTERQMVSLESSLPFKSFAKDVAYNIDEVRTAASNLQRSNDRFAAAEIIDQMQSYYDTAMVVFVDNIVILAVENCLLRPLGQLFTSQMVNRMSDEQIEGLATEPQQVQNERARLKNDLQRLRESKRTLSIFSTTGLEQGPQAIFGHCYGSLPTQSYQKDPTKSGAVDKQARNLFSSTKTSTGESSILKQTQPEGSSVTDLFGGASMISASESGKPALGGLFGKPLRAPTPEPFKGLFSRSSTSNGVSTSSAVPSPVSGFGAPSSSSSKLFSGTASSNTKGFLQVSDGSSSFGKATPTPNSGRAEAGLEPSTNTSPSTKGAFQ